MTSTAYLSFADRKNAPDESASWMSLRRTAFLKPSRVGPTNIIAFPSSSLIRGPGWEKRLGLRWNDIDESRVTFWLTKSGRSRSVPLTSRAKQAVEVNRGMRTGPFATIEQHKYRAVWNEAKLEVGLGGDADVVPHVLRHTCASRLVRGGVDIRRVQVWLGHQTLQMTMRYAHLVTHDLDMCVPILERR